MQTFSLNVRFEIANDRARAYVNDDYVGSARIYEHRGRDRLMFRCSDNPFRNFVPGVNDYIHDDTTIDELLKIRRVRENLIPIVIRNYLRNRSFLYNIEREVEGMDALNQVLPIAA